MTTPPACMLITCNAFPSVMYMSCFKLALMLLMKSAAQLGFRMLLLAQSSSRPNKL